jgi:hypothetical protein
MSGSSSPSVVRSPEKMRLSNQRMHPGVAFGGCQVRRISLGSAV